MNLDFTVHRLSSEADLKPYYKKTFKVKSGTVTFWEYAEMLYLKILYMTPEESFKVDDLVDDDNRDVFIKILCAFILSGVANGFRFNNTYTEFRRCSAPIIQSKENILKQTLI